MAQKRSSFPLLPIVAFVLFFTGILFFIAQNTSLSQRVEPLAEPKTLSRLIQGEDIPEPEEERYAQFHGFATTPPALASLKRVNRVLGTTSPNDKRIEVDLSKQRVYAYEGNRKVFEFLTSTGKWGATPTGTFAIWVKVRSQKMSGGSGATYYYLPNVPYVMFFGNDQVPASRGFSFHGTYWHNNFGYPMSHGCVNLRTEDAAVLFDWATPVVSDTKAWSTHATADNPGTEVVIYGETPDQAYN